MQRKICQPPLFQSFMFFPKFPCHPFNQSFLKDRLQLAVHVADDSDDRSEQDAALAEVPERGLVDEITLC